MRSLQSSDSKGGEMLDSNDTPIGWNNLYLEDICFPAKSTVDPATLEEMPYIGLEHVDSGEIGITRWGRSGDVKSSKAEFRQGDVLYGKLRPYLDKAVLAPWAGVCTTELLVLRSDPQKILPGFLVCLLHSKPFVKYAINTTAGTNLPRTSWNSIKEYACALPPVPEQRAMAHVLRTVQRAKEATGKVIAATRQLKQSLMRHLFTYGPVPFDKADRVSLHATEIGNLPEPWQIIPLGEESSIGNGSTPKRTNARYWEGGTIPWLTSAKVYDRVIRAADEFVTEVARHECHLPLVPKGSLVVAITGQGKTLGNTAILAIDACVSQHLAYVTFNTERLIPEYALAYLRSRYDELQSVSRSGGSTKGALTCGYLRGFCLPVPPSTEQCKIVEYLSALDTKQMAEEGRKCILDSLFRSLLHGLMTGQIRLPGFASGKV